jgi:hypothetical protein
MRTEIEVALREITAAVRLLAGALQEHGKTQATMNAAQRVERLLKGAEQRLREA